MSSRPTPLERSDEEVLRDAVAAFQRAEARLERLAREYEEATRRRQEALERLTALMAGR